jgi:hypothetical protein
MQIRTIIAHAGASSAVGAADEGATQDPAWLTTYLEAMRSEDPSVRMDAHSQLVRLFSYAAMGRDRGGVPHRRLKREILAGLERETARGGRLHDVAEAHFSYAQILQMERRYADADRELSVAIRLAGGRLPGFARPRRKRDELAATPRDALSASDAGDAWRGGRRWP